ASLVAFQATSSVTLDVSGLTLNGMNLGVVGSDTNITLTDMVISSMTTRAVRITDGSLVMTRVTVTNNNAVSVQSTRTTVTITDSTISDSANIGMQVDGGTAT